jgi:hypothetical protein
MLRHRPGHGWPLSIVTLLELLVDLDNVNEERFPYLRERMDLAHRLCKGRVLEEPRVLICRDVLRIPFPADLVAPSGKVLLNYMQLIRRARSLKEIRDGRVRWGRRSSFH